MKERKNFTKDLTDDMKEVGEIIISPERQKAAIKNLFILLFGIIIGVFIGLSIGGIYFSNKYKIPKENKEIKETPKKDKEESHKNIKEPNYEELYKSVKDNRNGNFSSWIYGQEKELFVANMSETSKMGLVLQNIKEEKITRKKTSLDQTEREEGVYEYGVYEHEVLSKLAMFIEMKTVKETYENLFGTLDTFKQNVDIPSDGAHNVLFTYNGNLDGYLSIVKPGGFEQNYELERIMTSKKLIDNKTVVIEEQIKAKDPSGQIEEEKIEYTFNYSEKLKRYIFVKRSVK